MLPQFVPYAFTPPYECFGVWAVFALPRPGC